ncbi:MAG TPA: hypothetical protein VMX94_03980 [Armatimonadota bacterium]|nr:hypothetical protein [Armatimonadota bacterium]
MTAIRWFYVLLSAIAIAGAALVVERLTGSQRPAYVQAIVAAALVVIFISLVGFLSKLRD